MFEFGTLGELIIIAAAVLILYGPKEIPVVLKALGKFTYKLRSKSYALKSYLNALMQEGEAEAIHEDLKKHNKGKNSKKNAKRP